VARQQRRGQGEAPGERGGADGSVRLATIAREYGRIGLTGFGGPPALIAMLRDLCVVERRWVSEHEFQDALGAANLLPGPAAKQLGIYCAWRVRGAAGAIVGGICFSLPGLIIITALAALFLAEHPPLWAKGAAAGAGAAVAAVAVNAAVGLIPASWRREGRTRPAHARWLAYTLLGGVAAASVGPYLVLVLLACGLAEVAVREAGSRGRSAYTLAFFPPLGVAAAAGGMAALCWVAFKVGALSYGGGFVIVPLMQHDAVSRYHWMTAGQFLTAVALGQITPGPVVQTVAVVGYAAAGVLGAVVAAVVAFTPTFVFVLAGARHFDQLRGSTGVQGFLNGAGPAAVGAIAGSAIPLALAISHLWQVGVLAAATVWIVLLRRNLVLGLLAAGLLGVVAALAGLPVG
jgi:chromate transporter